MAFLPDVMTVKKELKELSENAPDKKVLYDLLCKLTEPREVKQENEPYLSIDAYEEMWRSLYKHSDPADHEGGHWVICFLKAVINASSLPPYFYKNKADKTEIIKKIEDLSNQLIRIYKVNDLDAHVVLNNENLLSIKAKSDSAGLYVYEDLFEVEKPEAGNFGFLDEIRGDEFASFTTVIEHFCKRSKRLLQQAANERGSAGHNVHAIRFIRKLGKHNMIAYENPLNKVISVTAFSLFGNKVYPENEISTLLRGRTKNA